MEPEPQLGVPTFWSLGVRTRINCQGTYTIIGGSRALPQVVQAMVVATHHYVQMDELMERVGERLAELTGAGWGYVSSGCAAALAEVTAACIAGADPEKMARLPDTSGMRNEVVVQAAHRTGYDRAVRMAGARLVEVVTPADLEAALGKQTAMVLITGDQADRGQIPVPAMIEVARQRGVPCLVDAAAERPDVPNVYLTMGADAVAYSGGKCLRGPQASGLVLGRRDLLWAAYLNAAPHHGLGRPMKAGREEIMGLLAAVEMWVLGRDHAAEWRAWEGYLERIRLALAALPSVETSIQQPGVANVAPTLRISWDPRVLGCTPEQAHRELLDGEPAIGVNPLPDGLLIMPYMMEPGEDQIVAARLRELLSARREPAAPVPVEATAADLSGSWTMEIRYVRGAGTHALALEQEGQDLRGTYRSQYSREEARGRIHGREILLRVTLGYQSSRTEYAFTGTVGDDGRMTGTVTLGQFGTAQWVATRVA